MKLSIGYVGLSHLGINYAIASAMKGFNITCYDNNKTIIPLLKRKKIPFYEKGAEKNLKKRFKQFKFTQDINDLKSCNIVFISKDVPTNSKGKSDLNIIKKLINNVTKSLSKKCNIVILCQVPPGFTRSIKWPKNRLFYQVETLIFSNALERALSPERIIIGKNQNKIDKKYNYFLKKFNCPIIQMNYESAELAKISINIFLVASITSTNILSEASEKMGANWSDVANAIKLDKRIGKYAYLKPGLGISGGNLERDLETFKKFVKFNKIYESYSRNLKNISNYRKKWTYSKFEKILKTIKNIKKVGILGLTYKEGTNSIKNSPSIFFIKKILFHNKITINVFDPMIKKLPKYKVINFCKNEDTLLNDSEILIIATPWKSFKKIKIKKFPNIKAVIDPYRLMDISKNKKKYKYISMGN